MDSKHNILYLAITESRSGQLVLIPRCDIPNPDGDRNELNANWIRNQYPVRPCFTITINKSQSQTYHGKVGIYLDRHIFSHGQLYVALSRATNIRNICMIVKKEKWKDRTTGREIVTMNLENIIYRSTNIVLKDLITQINNTRINWI